MLKKTIRVRFAPSPTGGLHLGGIRTALFNYLFAKQHQGTFILRIEDTDQTRYVPGSEEYLLKCLRWCGLEPDESIWHGGDYGPYKQSQRKHLYQRYATQLIEAGYAYYAFDTIEELEQMRQRLKTPINPTPQYNATSRKYMRNSLTLSSDETASLLAQHRPYVVRIKMPSESTELEFIDKIRGTITFSTKEIDDKILLKTDGMPTYHLAVVVDDKLMKISQVFRGEEWLSSTPIHLLLWKWLGWENDMPEWIHLPLILNPEGKGKLSKRYSEDVGVPIYAMDWQDPKSGKIMHGFREQGFLPEAFINMLAMLGWSSSGAQELFSLEELIHQFSLEHIRSTGAYFDFEKAIWFNQQHLLRQSNSKLVTWFIPFLQKKGIFPQQAYVERVVSLVKERCRLLPDLWDQGFFFFQAPIKYNFSVIKSKWALSKQAFFIKWAASLTELNVFSAANLEASFKALALEYKLVPNELLLSFRIMLCGDKVGPPIFLIAETIGKDETLGRIKVALPIFLAETFSQTS